MRLKAVILENFRAYQGRILIPMNNLTAFIGKNDVGKSTILEALDIFFEGGVIKIESGDACVYSQSKEVRIGCVFDELPDDLILDTTAQTSLVNEYLLNTDADLEIHKVYDCSKAKPTAEIFAIANHPSVNKSSLLLLKQAELKKICSDLNIDLRSIDQRVNAQLRYIIWKHYNTTVGLQQSLSEIPLNKEDAKEIWGRISSYLPMYALFQADRSSNDNDSEVQDPMKLAIKQALINVAQEIDAIKAKVQEEVTAVAKRTLEKLAEMDADLASELKPLFTSMPKWEGFGLTLEGDNGIPINKRGSGIRRLILLNFFRAEAERKAHENSKQSVIYAIEEPETGQHPNNQRMLIEALLELSETSNNQVIVTTHVPSLAGMIPIDNLRYITRVNNQVQIQYGNVAHNFQVFTEIAKTLGVAPSPHHPKVILCVEGIHDVEFWYRISAMLHKHDPLLPDLSNDSRVAVVAVGGSNLKYWVEYNYLKDFEIPEIHIYDQDELGKYQPHCNKVNARTNGSWAILTSKRTIENYLHPDAIYDSLAISVSFTDSDDVPAIVAQAREPNWTGLNDKEKKGRANVQKHPLNRDVVEKMTVSRLKLSDPSDEVINWLKKIAAFF